MEKENKKIEELNNMELMRLIFDEVKRNGEELNRINDELKVHRNILNEHSKKLEEHDKRFEEIDSNLKHLDEKIDTIYQELKEEINTKFNCLDEKIDNTKKALVSEVAEEFKNFSVITSESINNLEKKIDNEIEDRKVDVSKVKEFNRIILNDIRSRVSILEEETEKYNLK